MYKIVKDKILYQATNRDYKVGDIIVFGKERNGQAKRVYEQHFKMPDSDLSVADFLRDKIKNGALLTEEEIKTVHKIVEDYEFCLREIGMERCRQKNYNESPSRLSGMFLTDDKETAKAYCGSLKNKLGSCGTSKACVLKLNGKLLKTDNAFNQRGGRSIDEFEEQAKKYFEGVSDDFKDQFVEYLFEGTAEVVDILK